jgi:transcription antitermination factor NusG
MFPTALVTSRGNDEPIFPSPHPPDRTWFAAYTCPRHEKTVARQLRERSIEHFLPLYSTVRRWKDRRKSVELALFPSYIFVRPEKQEMLRVLQLPSVVRFVSFNGLPAPLPETEIEALQSGIANGLAMQAHPFLTVGRRVRVIAGPLAGAQGILIRRKQKSRIVISIDALLRSVAVDVDAADVAPIL